MSDIDLSPMPEVLRYRDAIRTFFQIGWGMLIPGALGSVEGVNSRLDQLREEVRQRLKEIDKELGENDLTRALFQLDSGDPTVQWNGRTNGANGNPQISGGQFQNPDPQIGIPSCLTSQPNSQTLPPSQSTWAVKLTCSASTPEREPRIAGQGQCSVSCNAWRWTCRSWPRSNGGRDEYQRTRIPAANTRSNAGGD